MSKPVEVLAQTLYRYFPAVDAFGKRELPKKSAINTGLKIMRLRELVVVLDERRMILVNKHAEKVSGETVVDPETGGAKFVNPAAFHKEWNKSLDVPIEEYPKFKKKLTINELPKDVTSYEIEALVRLQLMDTPKD